MIVNSGSRTGNIENRTSAVNAGTTGEHKSWKRGPETCSPFCPKILLNIKRNAYRYGRARRTLHADHNRNSRRSKYFYARNSSVCVWKKEDPKWRKMIAPKVWRATSNPRGNHAPRTLLVRCVHAGPGNLVLQTIPSLSMILTLKKGSAMRNILIRTSTAPSVVPFLDTYNSQQFAAQHSLQTPSRSPSYPLPRTLPPPPQ